MKPRIRLALDYSPLDHAAMEWVAGLARRLSAEMEAWFIEDTELFRLAELPFTRQSGGDHSGFTPDALARQMLEQATQLERQLRELTTASEVPLHFSRVRGRVLEEIRRACEDTSLLVLQGFASLRPRLGARPLRRANNTLMAVYDGSAASDRTLALALQQAPAAQLHVLLQADDRQRAAAVHQHLSAQLAQYGVTTLITTYLPLHDGDHLIHLARLEQPAAVFIPANNSLLADHPMRELISALPCPLAIVGQMQEAV